MNGFGGGASNADTSCSGVMFLRSTNVPCWSAPVSSRSLAMKMNARGSRIRFCWLSRAAIVDAVSPSSTRNSTWAGSVETGRVSACPRSSRTMSATNGNLSAPGLSCAQPRIAEFTTGRSAVSATISTSAASSSAKIRNLNSPKMPLPPRPRRRLAS